MAGTEFLGELSRRIIGMLLDEEPPTSTPISEASVHLPRRGTRWMAVFTGPSGGQTWRSTGLVSRHQALRLARQWEREARLQREKLGRTNRTPVLRRGSGPGTEGGLLTQKEVALLLGISERACRAIEHRAIEKLRKHPLLRGIWRAYLAGDLEEQQSQLTATEVAALLSLTVTPTERQLLQKVLQVTQG